MSISRNLLFGAVAGAAATYVMTQFQNKASPFVQKLEKNSPSESHSEPATTRIAEKVYSSLRHSELPENQKERAGTLAHYTFGIVMGLGFGALSGWLPSLPSLLKMPFGRGILFGSLVWLFADELGTAAAKLAPPPWKVSKSLHAYALVSHLVYGVALSGIYTAEERMAS